MKKFFTLCLAVVALGASVSADELKILKVGPSLEDALLYQLYGEAISADGRYVCGSVNFGVGLFVADAFTGEVKCQIMDDEDTDACELRGVSNSGLAIGFTEYGATYSFADNKIVDLVGPKNTRGVLGENITNDGSVMVGSILESRTQAAFSKGGGDWTKLPLPSDEEILLLYPKIPDVSAAKKVSGDGKVILGFIEDFGVPCLWTLNDNGEYVPDLFPIKFLKLPDEDKDNDLRPLIGVSAHYLSISNNGRYVALLGLIPKKETDRAKVPIVYDTQEKSLKVYSEPQEIDKIGVGLYPLAIADDGTFIGTIDEPYFGTRGSFIMKAGQSQAELFIEAFPEFNDRYADGDILGQNMPTGISADGRYIVGYMYYSEDYIDPEVPIYYETYIIDRGEDTAVGQVSVANIEDAIYSIDGRRLNRLAKGINIIRNSDGSVKKILKK